MADWLADLPAPDLSRPEMAAWVAGYMAGHDRGREEGRAEAGTAYDARIAAALTRMLGGPDATSWTDAVDRHHRAVSQLAARRLADQAVASEREAA